jgi:hypothetical protein
LGAREKLRYIRKVSSAHRDHDPQLIVEVIEKLDILALLQMAQELTTQLDDFSSVMVKVLGEMNIVKEVFKGFSPNKK